MHSFLPTIILRHRKENLKKCSLRGLESREDCLFYTYPKKLPDDLHGYVLITMEGKELSCEDRDKGLYLLDSTWKYEKVMRKTVPETVEARSLPPGFRTAYPRKQTACDDPETGLATVEALYIARYIVGQPTDGLLDQYHWKEAFLSLNKDLFIELDKKL